ncbi:hypothetical protein P7C73_g288, partial [Tremellales sp. Uapishka_1]
MMAQASSSSQTAPARSLTLEEYERYGRQMIMPGFGLPGQLRLKHVRVAVIGAGGLGCPVLQYLAGAGVGTIGIFDHDDVGLSNLHRQILHTTDRVGMKKVDSACISLRALNPNVKLLPHRVAITPSAALELLRPYTLIIDCTDRPVTRYLLSDTAVRLSIPLVSGAAISSAGQWAVYGGSRKDGKRRACYRCVWPSVLPGAGGNGNCEEQGVWGVVTGLVGTGMASEVIKAIVGIEDSEPLLHLLHLNSNPLIRTIRLRPPSPKCIACGLAPTITDNLEEFEYESFCLGSVALEEADEHTGRRDGMPGERMSVKELREVLDSTDIILIDTRPPIEFGICALPNSTNIPLSAILSSPTALPSNKEIIIICRKGNDSQLAAAKLRSTLTSAGPKIRDVRGGLVAWSKEVDSDFPIY